MSPLATSLRFLQTQSDARLVELSHEGHERAFEALVHRYRRELLAYCRRLTRARRPPRMCSSRPCCRRGWRSAPTSTSVTCAPGSTGSSTTPRSASSAGPVHDPVEDRHSGLGRGRVRGRAPARGARRAGWTRRPPGASAPGDAEHRARGPQPRGDGGALGLTHGAVRGLIYRARATLRAAAAAVIPGPLDRLGRSPGGPRRAARRASTKRWPAVARPASAA